MKNRNDELEYEGFDYDDYEEEQLMKKPCIEVENPYDDYEMFDVEITETVVKKLSVFAKDAESAKEYIEMVFKETDELKDIDKYERTVSVEDCGSASADYTVPPEWYEWMEEVNHEN